MNNSKEEKTLNEYISVYDKNIQDLALYIRDFVAKKHPKANQLIYDAYNAVSIVFSFNEKLQDAFCHIALYKRHVNFGFPTSARCAAKRVLLALKASALPQLVLKSLYGFSDKL